MDSGLSGKLHEVLWLISIGLSDQAIAQQLSTSTGTVRNYCAYMCEKLQATNRNHATYLAFSQGLVDADGWQQRWRALYGAPHTLRSNPTEHGLAALRLRAHGHTYQSIGQQLFISQKAAEDRIRQLLVCLGVPNSAGAVAAGCVYNYL